MSTWTPAFPLADLPLDSARLYRDGPHQVAVLRDEAGTLFAVDNLCPHEGYPLVQGLRSGCTLTCAWHNWKFDLRDGANLKGGEDVRTYPVRVVDGVVQLDLAPPDPAAERARLWASLEGALVEYRVDQASRDAVRLLLAGARAAEIAAFAAAFDGQRAEYGATHALPVAWDVLRWCRGGPEDAVPLSQALDLAGVASVRRPPHPAVPPEDPGDDPVAAGLRLAERVEAEDGAGAEALLRGALARGWGRPVLEPWLYAVVSEHFLSFGHRLIYQSKVFDLLDAGGWQHAEAILGGHLRGIVAGTREDVLPAWKPWRQRVEALDLAALWAVPPDPAWQRATLEPALVEGSAREALDATIAALSAGAPPVAVCDALSLAAAERMLRFEVAHDGDQGVQDGWLSVTHVQTFAAAARVALQRWADPRVLRFLLQGARFVAHHRVLDGPRPDLAPAAGTTDQVLAAITGKDAARAVALAASDPPGLDAALLDLALSDLAGAPIVQAHLIKNTLVGLDETAATGDPRPRLALVRLLASPLQQRWVQRGALEALAFVTAGRKPRLLAP